jgi:hypothetical protein
MATGVGLRIAEDECLAAIVIGGGEPDEGSPAPQFIVRASVLHMSDDGDTELGGDPPAGHTHSITGFVSTVGDPAGIPVDDGEAYRAEDLVATALFCLIDLAAAHLAGPAEFYAVHPARWPAAQVLALRDALDYLGLRSVVLVSEAILPDAATGREYATAAARGALAAVLSTPAGATPPDPTRAENPLESTDVLPALRTQSPAQAYSAAIAVQDVGLKQPAPQPDTESAETAATQVEPVLVTGPSPKTSRGGRRTPILIAAAAAVGLLLGGAVVGIALRNDSATPAPSAPDASSDFAPTTRPVTTTPPPPVAVKPAPPPAVPRQLPARRTAPPVTTPPPPTTTLPTATTTDPYEPATTTPTTDPYPPDQSPYPPYTFDPFDPNTFDPFAPPTMPMPPGLGLPSVSSP